MPVDSFDPAGILTTEDVAFIEASGRSPEKVIQQAKFLREKHRPTKIIRPATIGDGIQQLASYDSTQLNRLHEEAAGAGRLAAFIPASGSGTRLFQNLLALHWEREHDIEQLRQRAADGDSAAKDALIALENINELAIWDALGQAKPAGGSVGEILTTLFDERGPGYHHLPKGLIPFHRYSDHVRTAFVEHIYEAVALVTDENEICRIHFTISPSHRAAFEHEWQRLQPQVKSQPNAKFQVDFSEQSDTTDTIAVDLEGNLHRDASGRIVFRPGGHGSLLQNLAGTNADILLIKNIDNVTRQEFSARIVEIRKQISGLLLLVESEVHGAIRELRAGSDPQPALALLQRMFGRGPNDKSPAPLKDYLLDQFNRPLRVCGVVRALGQAGGGPFWIEDEANPGPWLQIVEGAEIDLNDPAAKELFEQSTHFNPVDIACSLRDLDGRQFDLEQFTMTARALIAHKTLDGVPSLLYEHPGLWNGGMGLWNTVFVEIPDYTFNPVKTISDLHGPGHRA